MLTSSETVEITTRKVRGKLHRRSCMWWIRIGLMSLVYLLA